MPVTKFSFRVDEQLKQQFTAVAKECDRSGAELLRDFMRDYVREQWDPAGYDAWFRQQVQIGLESANAGRLVPAEEVEAQAAAWRAKTRRRTADAKS